MHNLACFVQLYTFGNFLLFWSGNFLCGTFLRSRKKGGRKRRVVFRIVRLVLLALHLGLTDYILEPEQYGLYFGTRIVYSAPLDEPFSESGGAESLPGQSHRDGFWRDNRKRDTVGSQPDHNRTTVRSQPDRSGTTAGSQRDHNRITAGYLT